MDPDLGIFSCHELCLWLFNYCNYHFFMPHILQYFLMICYLLLDRDVGSGIALKTLKRVEKGWGQGSISSLLPQKNDFLDY